MYGSYKERNVRIKEVIFLTMAKLPLSLCLIHHHLLLQCPRVGVGQGRGEGWGCPQATAEGYQRDPSCVPQHTLTDTCVMSSVELE